MPDDKYIGDGVYLSFDEGQIWLAVGHHANKVVALEPFVMKRLTEEAAQNMPELRDWLRWQVWA
jgi:hypothetical protein